MVFGKLIGGVLGFFSAGLFGLIIGVIVGHFFDRGVGQAMGFDYGAERARLQRLFFETTFTIMGHIAKADGRISEQEIQQAEQLMARLGLNADHRQEAIRLFKQGADSDFQLEPVISRFINEGGRHHNLPMLLLEFLFSIALADGVLHPAEQDILQRVANYLGIGSRQFAQLLAMLQAQRQFFGGQWQSGQQGGHRYGTADTGTTGLASAYQALGVTETDSDRDIKRAYRKLMSQHHPDKLIAQGVPEDMVKMATEKSQEIQAAYDVIKNARGMR